MKGTTGVKDEERKGNSEYTQSHGGNKKKWTELLIMEGGRLVNTGKGGRRIK